MCATSEEAVVACLTIAGSKFREQVCCYPSLDPDVLTVMTHNLMLNTTEPFVLAYA